jgi:hypothetical protein
MDAIEFIIYTILLFVLIAFIGVLGYIIYDNYTYKKDLKLDLNTNFKDINNNFDSTSNIINKLHGKQTNNFNIVSDKVDNYNKLFTSNILDINSKYDAKNKLFTSNIGTFSYNLNKYFSFNNNNDGYNDGNKKIFEYRTADADINKLNLITKTTATAGLKINSDADKELEICNNMGNNCYNISNNDNGLFIYKKDGENNIYIGANNVNAPLKIVKGVASINGVTSVTPNVGEISATSGTKTATISFTGASGGKGYTGHVQNPTLTITGGVGTGLQIGNFTYSDEGSITAAQITNHGTGYTSVPSITFTPPVSKAIKFTATPTITPTVSTNSFGALTTLPEISLTTTDNGYYKKDTSVTITNNSRKAGAIAQTDANGIMTITIKNIVNGNVVLDSSPLDNGFYVAANVKISSISSVLGVSFITDGQLSNINSKLNATITNGVLTAIAPSLSNNWGTFTPSQTNLSVVLSDPESPDIATITPVLNQTGTITSLTLTTAGSKYYKPTITVNDSNLVTPQNATFTLFKFPA